MKIVNTVAPQVQGQTDHRPVQARLNKRIERNQFPAGFDGDTLTLDTHSASGLKWRTGTNRLVHDLDPELSAELDCNGNKIVELGTPTAGTDAVTKTYADALVLERSYCLASKTISVTTTGRSGLTYYWAKPTGWTLHTSDEWSESSGNFTYSGAFPASGSRVFRVTYAVGVSGWVSLTFWNFLVKVTKIPSGGAEADVAGSSVGGGAGYGGVSAFGVYFSSHSVSASTLVEIAPGDTLAFQYGSHVSTAGTYNTQFSTTNNGDGIVLSITPADIAP